MGDLLQELPIGTWTQAYKTFLEEQLSKGILKNFNEYHTDNTVNFTITMPEEKLEVRVLGSSLFSYGVIERFPASGSREERFKEIFQIEWIPVHIKHGPF